MGGGVFCDGRVVYFKSLGCGLEGGIWGIWAWMEGWAGDGGVNGDRGGGRDGGLEMGEIWKIGTVPRHATAT